MDGLLTHAILYKFYEDENNIVEITKKLIILIIHENSSASVDIIKNNLHSKHKIELPKELIKTLLKKLKKEKKIDYTTFDNNISLTNVGEESAKIIQRTFHKFSNSEEYTNFIPKIKEKLNKKYSEEDIRASLQRLIPCLYQRDNPANEIDRELINILKNDENLLDIYEHIARGKIIQFGLYEIRSKKKIDLSIILDTNILLLFLGNKIFSDPLKKLFKSCKDLGFDLKIFDFTMDELFNSLNNQEVITEHSISDENLNLIRVDFEGWASDNGIEIIYENIEDILSKNCSQNIKNEDVDPNNRKFENAIKHDKAIISYIINSRAGTSKAIFHKSENIFLSADKGILRKFSNFDETLKNGRFVEAISVENLYNYLFIRGENIISKLSVIDIVALSYPLEEQESVLFRVEEVSRVINDLKNKGFVESGESNKSIIRYIDVNEEVALLGLNTDEKMKVEIIKSSIAKKNEVSKLEQKKNADDEELKERRNEDKEKCKLFANCIVFFIKVLLLVLGFIFYLLSFIFFNGLIAVVLFFFSLVVFFFPESRNFLKNMLNKHKYKLTQNCISKKKNKFKNIE